MPTPISSVSNCNARRQTLKKLVPQTGTSRLVQVTCTCVSQSANLVQVFLVQVSCTQLSTALFQHSNCPARDTNRATWLAGELFWYKKTVMNLRQIFRASFWYQFLKSFLSMCHRHNNITDTTLHSKNKITICKSPSAKIFLTISGINVARRNNQPTLHFQQSRQTEACTVSIGLSSV